MNIQKLMWGLVFIVSPFLLKAQSSPTQITKIYVEYSNDCMTKMEYKETVNQNAPRKIHYYAKENTNSFLILELSSESTNVVPKPAHTLSCNQIMYNNDLLNKINTGEYQLYIVNKVVGGYTVSYVSTASTLKSTKDYFYYNSMFYGLSHNTSEVYTGNNLANNGELFEIYYQGNTGIDCLESYTYRKSNRNSCGSHTDITICPQLGILKTTELSKLNPELGPMSNYQLVYINNLPVDNYVGAVCSDFYPKDPTLSTIVSSNSIKNTNPNLVVPSTSTTDRPSIVEKPNVVGSKPVSYYMPTAPNLNSNGTPSVNTQVNLVTSYDNTVYPDFTKVNTNDLEDKGNEKAKPSTVIKKCPLTAPQGYHVVQPDETLHIISQKRGITVKQLAAWNNIDNLNKIEACSVLKLSPGGIPSDYEFESKSNTNARPNADYASLHLHLVKDGETLYQIAKKYGFTVEKFMQFNDLSTDVISPGMTLKTSNCSCDIPDEFNWKGVQIPSDYGEPVLIPDNIPEEFEQKGTKVAYQSKFHTLTAGETLYRVAKQYNVSVESLLSLNDISDPTELSVGQIIRVQ